MTNDATHEAVVAWIASATNVVTIAAYQSGKVPAEPYIMVNMTGFFEVRTHEQDIVYTNGIDPPGDDPAPVTATPIIETEWRFSVHAYGTSPTDILRPVVSAVKLAQAQEPLMPGLIIHEISQIRHVPDWVNERWQDRAQMDFNIRGLTKDGHVIDVIEEASFDIARSTG